MAKALKVRDMSVFEDECIAIRERLRLAATQRIIKIQSSNKLVNV